MMKFLKCLSLILKPTACRKVQTQDFPDTIDIIDLKEPHRAESIYFWRSAVQVLNASDIKTAALRSIVCSESRCALRIRYLDLVVRI
jgi:hypothetical protein